MARSTPSCVVALLAGALAGCQGTHVQTATALAADRPICAAPREHRPMQPRRPRPSPHRPHAAAALTDRAYQGAVRLGLLEVVDELARLAEQDPTDATVARRRGHLLQRLRDTVQVATSSVLALAAELECEEELATRLAEELEQGRDRRITTLTAVAIALGAVAAVTAGSLSLAGHGRAAEAVAIGGGTAEAGLGASILFSRTRSVALEHPHNHLAEVWEGSEAARLLPPFVWAWIEATAAEEDTSPRERILRRIRPLPTHRRDLILGTGGEYSGSDLRLRAELIDMLEDQIELIYRDLVLLLEQSLALGLPPDERLPR